MEIHLNDDSFDRPVQQELIVAQRYYRRPRVRQRIIISPRRYRTRPVYRRVRRYNRYRNQRVYVR